MHKLLVLTIATAFIQANGATAQQKRKSPHEQVSISLGVQKITISYGRPYMRGRKIMGGLVPYNKVWRTGADEATQLTTTADLQIGELKVPKGSYSLFTMPTANGWKLIVNTVADQWGAFDYNEGKDLGRADMNVTKNDSPVEQFTISLDKAGEDQGVLKMSWESTAASVPIKVLR